MNCQTRAGRLVLWRRPIALLSFLLALSMLLLPGSLATTALAGQEKVAVCHLNGEGNYIPITIAD